MTVFLPAAHCFLDAILILIPQGKPQSRHQSGGICFWDGKHDPVRARERVMKAVQLFQEKYPDVNRTYVVANLQLAYFIACMEPL